MLFYKQWNAVPSAKISLEHHDNSYYFYTSSSEALDANADAPMPVGKWNAYPAYPSIRYIKNLRRICIAQAADQFSKVKKDV
jgi:hypothetical protein